MCSSANSYPWVRTQAVSVAIWLAMVCSRSWRSVETRAYTAACICLLLPRARPRPLAEGCQVGLRCLRHEEAVDLRQPLRPVARFDPHRAETPGHRLRALCLPRHLGASSSAPGSLE